MTRAAAVIGLFLAVVFFLGGFPLGGEEARLSMSLALGGGAVFLALALGTLGGRRWAPVFLGLAGLSTLGWSLPTYFRTSAMWPYLALIILGSATFGLSILGVLLRGYPASNSRPL